MHSMASVSLRSLAHNSQKEYWSAIMRRLWIQHIKFISMSRVTKISENDIFPSIRLAIRCVSHAAARRMVSVIQMCRKLSISSLINSWCSDIGIKVSSSYLDREHPEHVFTLTQLR